MKRLISVVMLALLAVGIFASTSEAALSSNKRRAVVLECFYALRPSHDGGCDKTIPSVGGNCVSNWRYLYDDTSAYNVVKNWYGTDSSVWSVFYTDPYSYSYGTFGGSYGSVGRGGQCKYFANLILYRSGSETNRIPDFYTLWTTNYENDMSKAQEGDVILTYNMGIKNHIAIVVEIKKDGNGNVTGLDVIDANYITDTGGADREVIGRHLFPIASLQQYYRISTWPGYYGTKYDPNAP